MQDLLVWHAIINWKDDILKKDILQKSKTDYLSNMSKLIESGFLDIEQSLSEFRKLNILDLLKRIDETKDWSSSTKQSRKALFRSFYRFASKNKIELPKTVIPFLEYRSIRNITISELLMAAYFSQALSSNKDKARSQFLTDNQIEQFFNEIRSINERDFLICWAMWVLKCTIHQVLNLIVSSYNSETKVFKIGENDFRLGYLRPDFEELILKQCEGKQETELMFPTANGKSIHPGQIVRNMKTASKRANLPIIISPKILYAHAIEYGKEAFSAMSEKEKEKLYKAYERQSWAIDEKMKNVFAE